MNNFDTAITIIVFSAMTGIITFAVTLIETYTNDFIYMKNSERQKVLDNLELCKHPYYYYQDNHLDYCNSINVKPLEALNTTK